MNVTGKITTKATPCTPSGVGTKDPNNTPTQIIANENTTIRPYAAAMSSTPEWIRHPTTNPVTVMNAIGRNARSRLATACPASTLERWIGSEGEQDEAALLGAVVRASATPKQQKTIVWAKIPPIRNSL